LKRYLETLPKQFTFLQENLPAVLGYLSILYETQALLIVAPRSVSFVSLYVLLLQ